jgi:hypothetical protein
MDLFKMKTMKMTTVAAAVAVLAFGATQASALPVNGDTQQFTVTASVANAVTLAEVQALDWGVFVVVVTGDNVPPTIGIPMTNAGVVTWTGAAGNGSVGNEWSLIASNEGAFPTGARAATNGSYSIAGAAFFSTLQVVYNNEPLGTTPTVLTCGACIGGNPTFSVGTFTDNTAGGLLVTDGTGAATLNVGATLSINNNGTANTTVDIAGVGKLGMTFAGQTSGVGGYEDGDYTGNLDISVIY